MFGLITKFKTVPNQRDALIGHGLVGE